MGLGGGGYFSSPEYSTARICSLFFSYRMLTAMPINPETFFSPEQLADAKFVVQQLLHGRIRSGNAFAGGLRGLATEFSDRMAHQQAQRVSDASFDNFWRRSLPNSPYLLPARAPKWMS